jgi:hypothetical protein
MERLGIVRGTVAVGEVGVRNELAAAGFGKFTRRRTPTQAQSDA